MPIVKEIALLKDAKSRKYAIPAFNVENFEMAQAVIEACNELGSPVIIAASTNTLKYILPNVFSQMVCQIANNFSIPVSIHLDHGKKKDDIILAIKNGFDSVMFDGSQLPFLENASLTKECKNICDIFGVCLEGELGAISGKKGEDLYLLTEPYMAFDFVNRTGVDSLAVAIGTSHGVYKSKPNLDYNRLLEISKTIEQPLVLHGASGLSEDQIKKCICYGISKVNFATDLRIAYTSSIRDYLQSNPDVYDPKMFGNVGILAVKEVVKKIVGCVGSEGKANGF